MFSEKFNRFSDCLSYSTLSEKAKKQGGMPSVTNDMFNAFPNVGRVYVVVHSALASFPASPMCEQQCDEWWPECY